MPTVDLLAKNTEAFVFARLIVAEALAFQLEKGIVRAQMRAAADSVLVYHEWSTTKGTIKLVPTAALGWFDFTKPPAAGETLTIGETVVTFAASGGTGLTVALGPDLDATLATLAAVLSASTDPDVASHTYAATDSRLTLVSKVKDATANSMALATDVDGATASGRTIRGGGTLLTMTASQREIARFKGSYVYDVRFEDDDGTAEAVLFGGALVFTQGITRT